MRALLRALARLALYWCALSVVGCGGSTPASPVSAASVRIEVVTHPTANRGRSVRLLVRAIDDPTTFLADEYGAMVRLATRPDASVLADRFLRPGTTLALPLNPPAEKTVVIYAFFSSPHPTRWKVRPRSGQTLVRLHVLENALELR